MGQIMFSRNPIGSFGLGLFLLGIGIFVYSAFDPSFGPIAIPCIAGGAVVSLLLWRRPFNVPHIDARHADAKKPAYKPIEPN